MGDFESAWNLHCQWKCSLITRRISPGPPTPCHSPRRHNSAYTFSTSWKEQVSHHPSSPHSTGAPLRVCWPAASLSGTGTVGQQTARPSSGQWTQLQRSSVPLYQPSWTFSLHDAPAKPTASWRTPPTPPTVSSSSCHQERRYRSIRTRGLHGSKNSYPNPKRPVNVLRGTDPDPYFIWKWDPNPCRPEKCLTCTTRTRRGPDHYSKVGPEPGWEDTDPTAPDRHILHSKCY